MRAAAAANEIRKALPELRERVPAGEEAAQPPEQLARIDITDFSGAFGRQWKSWEGAVVAVARDILKHEDPQQVGKKSDIEYDISA